jgi:hypothetical protein
MTLSPPTRGPPVSYIHVIWLAAGAGDVHEYYDELDAERWSIRCVRVYSDRSSVVAFSYDSPNWRDVMPEATIDDPEVINRDSQFRARTISREEFEIAWDAAHPENPLRFNIFDDAGQILCPCCGLAGQFNYPPYDAHGGIIGCGICACCMWEPGFDDHPGASALAQPTILASVRVYRLAWATAGYPWMATAYAAPPGWEPQATLATLFGLSPRLE